MNKLMIGLIMLLGSMLIGQQVLAFACYEDPIYERDWHGIYDIAAFVRDNPCVDGTTVLETVAAGTVVQINGETDGWYRVITPNGVEGWTGSALMSLTDAAITEVDEPEEEDPVPTLYDTSSITDRTVGYILLQTEQNGEAWYVNPEDKLRYYMKDGPTAYEMMRSFGLGITDADLDDIPEVDDTDEMDRSSSICSSNDLADRLKGKILLQVEQHGEAWYVDPDICRRIYMRDGDAAYSIMRYLSLGITDADLSAIDEGDMEDVYIEYETTSSTTASSASSSSSSELTISSYQRGEVPSGVDLMEVNEYWLDEINDLRTAAGLRELVLDQRFIDSATDWAGYEGEEVGYSTHTRPDGSSMHEWIEEWDYDWTERYSADGWNENYFTENISWNYVSGTTESVKDMMDQTIDWMLAEEGYNGAHYRSIYHEDWNTVGTGMYFEPNGNNYKVYLVIHYGSLEI